MNGINIATALEQASRLAANSVTELEETCKLLREEVKFLTRNLDEMACRLELLEQANRQLTYERDHYMNFSIGAVAKSNDVHAILDTMIQHAQDMAAHLEQRKAAVQANAEKKPLPQFLQQGPRELSGHE